MVKKQKEPEQKSNRLISEKSPYLLQHAHNPVDWYPWNDEAFGVAKKENKPIFLSIGYSTCHWCHVMEKESFEDTMVAKEMNDAFISIKVDREERPDIDKVYMTVCQALTGGGGWPLTIIMTPDKKPFFAATYISKEPRFNQPGLLQLIKSVKDLWQTRNYDAINNAEKIAFTLKNQLFKTDNNFGERLDENLLTKVHNQLERRFDSEFGGFGNAPKFPTPHNLMFLLRYWSRSKDMNALKMVEKTLKAMHRGGIYDHVGFGFHRYSTDSKWLVPHFEKMLYDQALIACVYIEAYQATGVVEFEKTAKETIEYVLRELSSPDGGFYSAEDADSEGVEGKFYTWSYNEIESLLGKKDAEFISKIYNIEPSGNFIDQILRKKTKGNILHLTKSHADLANHFKLQKKEFEKKINGIRKKIFEHRNKRVHPHMDDKILTDWNGLMIAALAKASQVFSNKQYSDAAEQAVKFIMDKMCTPKGELFHRFRDGESAIPGFINDYAFLIWGLIELYETTFDEKHLNFAIKLNETLIDHFWDAEVGGFNFSSDTSEELLINQKEIYDGAIPSGNSVEFLNLIRLSRLLKDPKLEDMAVKLGRTFSSEVKQQPMASTFLMIGLDFLTGPSYEILIEGDSSSEKTKKIIKTLEQHFLPNKIVHLNYKSTKQHTSEYINLPKPTPKDDTMVYICQNYSCQKPTNDISEMLELLGLSNTEN